LADPIARTRNGLVIAIEFAHFAILAKVTVQAFTFSVGLAGSTLQTSTGRCFIVTAPNFFFTIFPCESLVASASSGFLVAFTLVAALVAGVLFAHAAADGTVDASEAFLAFAGSVFFVAFAIGVAARVLTIDAVESGFGAIFAVKSDIANASFGCAFTVATTGCLVL